MSEVLIKHIVVDGFYSKEKFVNGVVGLGLDLVGKLRADANLSYVFMGEQKHRGRRRKYDGKVDLSDVSRFTWVQDLEANLKLLYLEHKATRRTLGRKNRFVAREPDILEKSVANQFHQGA